MIFRILSILFLHFISLNVFADELSNTFLKIPFGITLPELNKAFESRTDVLFLDTAYNVINGKLTFDHWSNSKEELSLKKQHSGAYKFVIGKDTLGEISFSFYSNKLYRIIFDGSPNEKMTTNIFVTQFGKPKVIRKRIPDYNSTYEEKKWLKNGMEVVLTLDYPNYPTFYLIDKDTYTLVNSIEDSYKKFEIKGVIESYQYPSGKIKDSVLEWEYENYIVNRIYTECLPIKYFLLKGYLKDFSVILKCNSTGEVVYREDNITLNKKMKLFEDLNVWFDYCVDSEEHGRYTIDVIKDDYTVFHGEVTRNACYE
jgi:hypothetical protein